MSRSVNGASRSKKRRGGKTGIKYIFGVLGALVTVLLVLVLGLRQQPQIPAIGSPGENLAMMQAVSKLSGAMLNRGAESVTVEFAPDEIDALLANAIRVWQLRHSEASDPVFFARWSDGAAYVEASLPLAGPLAVNVVSKLRPALDNRHLEVTLSDSRAGWLPLPGLVMNPVGAMVIERLSQSEEYRMAMEAVYLIQVTQEGNLAVTFAPGKMAGLISVLLRR